MARAPKANTAAKVPNFHEQLITSRWLLNFFNPNKLEGLKDRLDLPSHEGIADDGQTKFFYALMQSLFNKHLLDESTLRRYDLNVVKYWQQITEKRNRKEGVTLHLKYFQYLSLLVAEIYLDWYFNQTTQMLTGLNELLDVFNEPLAEEQRFQPYTEDDLNKVAYWSATGSGKTLILHVNILQYLHYYAKKNGDGKLPDRIILLTPNEGLSLQHFNELDDSGFHAAFFDKNKSSHDQLDKQIIQIIDINKLADEMGDKTVAVEAFTGNNLVLVDEGHRGAGTADGAWMRRREVLSQGGFVFEYSATFGQAVGKKENIYKATDDLKKKKAKLLFGSTRLTGLDEDQLNQLQLDDLDQAKAKQNALREDYAKSILFDYSYKYFYQDGYGKESLILNLKESEYGEKRDLYFTACLLAFYQQQYLFSTNQAKIADFNLEKPLWVFVGNKVNDDDSDVLAVIKFLSEFLANKGNQITLWLKDLLANTTQLLDTKGNNIFYDRFSALLGQNEDVVYQDILKTLFNSNSRQRLKVINTKGIKGELRLQVGDKAFGLINVGDESGLFAECENLSTKGEYLDTTTESFGESVFSTINDKDSLINILIGSKKFSEGWSSWRVSTMGLLNMGKGEGSQIIQLFGRGVRLKGQNYSLKRNLKHELQSNELHGMHIDKLQTINIFGVNANYMEAFKAYLKEEGVITQDEMLQLDFNTKASLPKHPLKTLTLKDGYKDNQPNGFKRQVFPVLYEIPAKFQNKIKLPFIELDLYPRLQALDSTNKLDLPVIQDQRNQGKIHHTHLHLFNFDRVYLSLLDYKHQRLYSNLQLSYEKLWDFCLGSPSWYTLYIPQQELDSLSLSAIRQQEEILIQLLKDYTDRFYKTLKSAYEGQFYTTTTVHADDDSLCKVYHISLENSDTGQAYLDRLIELQGLVDSKSNKLKDWSGLGQFKAIIFDRHLYYPLFDATDKTLPLKMTPLSFDAPSEIQFVRDLQAFYESSEGQETLKGYSLYLLRNADTKAKGLGFATAGNFYPDFLMWLVNDATGKQHLSLVDPKGIRQINLSDPKLQLYKEIKHIEKQLNDPNLSMSAFIVTPTSHFDLLNNTIPQEDLEAQNILFMESDKQYVKLLMRKILVEELL